MWEHFCLELVKEGLTQALPIAERFFVLGKGAGVYGVAL